MRIYTDIEKPDPQAKACRHHALYELPGIDPEYL
jgi:hypothetical protein